MSYKLEPAIWSCDTGQRIPRFDRCQLIIAWMSNIKEVHGKPRLFVSLEYGRHVGQLRRRRRRAYAPTSNTASHDNHEKINSWVSFFFRMMPMGLRSLSKCKFSLLAPSLRQQRALVLSPSSYKNTIFNQSTRVLS